MEKSRESSPKKKELLSTDFGATRNELLGVSRVD